MYLHTRLLFGIGTVTLAALVISVLVPLESIRDPLVGFTAVRGIEPLLRRTEEAKALQLSSIPNQACSWSMARVPYFTFAAYPQTGVSNLMWQTLPRLPMVLAWRKWNRCHRLASTLGADTR